MRIYSANAIVLKRIDLAERDRIVTLFTRERGKISAIAKGARKPGAKLSGSSEPFTYIKGLFSIGRELDVITQSEIKESFPNVKKNMLTIAYALYMMELVFQLTGDHHQDPDLFDNIMSSMYVLESGSDPELTVRHFELKVLESIGYMPEFNRCIRCGSSPGKDKLAFSPNLGGIVCKNCGISPGDAIWVPGALCSYFKALSKLEPHKIKDTHFPKAAMFDLMRTLKWHIRCRLERDLKSSEFLETISNLSPT